MADGFTLFDTAIGVCALAWRADRIVAVSLPESEPRRLRARFQQRFPEAVERPAPAGLAGAIEDIQALMRGDAVRFADAPLEWSIVGAFERKVYDIALRIAPGETRTYGEIARELGDLALSRAVGQALGANPFPPIVPCHRVLASGGKTGGFSAPGGVETKFRMLEIERAHAAPTDLFGGLAYQPRR